MKTQITLRTGSGALPAALALSMAAQAANLPPSPRARLEPATGCYVGVCLGGGDTIDSFSLRMGWKPAVYCGFFEFPLTTASRQELTAFLAQVRAAGGLAIVTLTPNGGLAAVTSESCAEFAQFCADQEAQGCRGIFARFGHEMNGNWYAWGQQPIAYKEKFRMLAQEVHSSTTRTAMLWTPSYGGGYPFAANDVQPGPEDFAELDTDGDGVLTQSDDCYEPYYPGDDAVDWVGLTIYHWGTRYPWLDNDVPEPNSFSQFLTGEYNGGNGDQTAVPDFYARYCIGAPHAKPLAIPETAAFFNPHQGGATELEIKTAWLRQVFNVSGDTVDAVDLARRFPQLKCVSWFDQYKFESETRDWIDWRASGYAPVRAAFLAAVRTLRDGRPWFLGAEDIPALDQENAVALLDAPAVLPLTGVFNASVFVRAQHECDLAIEVVDADANVRGGVRARMHLGEHRVTIPVGVRSALLDGGIYRCNAYLVQTNGDLEHALAVWHGVPQVARRITAAIRIVAAPPVFTPGTNVVRVQCLADQRAIAVVNVLDTRYQWQGGRTLEVDRGDRTLDLPVVLSTGIKDGWYLLDCFLSDSSTNWQRPMARAQSVAVEFRSEPARDSIQALVVPGMVRAGEVFRFVVQYAATGNRDLHIDLFDGQTNFLAGALQTVVAGSGVRDMTLSVPTAPPGDYFITAFITPPGRPWTEALAWSAAQPVTVLANDYCDWLQTYWGVLLSTDLIGPDDDPDGDGLSNSVEFQAGTNPRQSDGLVRASITRDPEGWMISWPSLAGQRYELLQIDDLERGSWTPASDVINGSGTPVQIAVPFDGRARFFRVQMLPSQNGAQR